MEINSSSRRAGSSSEACLGGLCHTLEGRYERNRRIAQKASSSLPTSLSTAPLPRACINDPPSSSLVTTSPTPRSTTGGPAMKSWLVPLTINEKCEATTRAAPSPATGPRQAPTTGTSDNSATTTSHEGFAGTYVRFIWSSVLTLPPPPVPSTSLTIGILCSRASNSP